MKPIACVALCVALSMSEPSVVAVETYPAKVLEAERTIDAWIGKLRGKSEKEVARLLGQPTRKSTWMADGGPQRQLLYAVPTGAELTLYFSKDGTVLVVSHSLRVQ
jgi:hypothetical protein